MNIRWLATSGVFILAIVIGCIWLSPADNQDDFSQAKYLVNTGEYEKAIELLRKMPETPHGSFLIGMLYVTGSGTAEDIAEARSWLQKSDTLTGRQGEASFGMAWNYIYGPLDRPPDYDRAAHWFKEAAVSGHSQAKELVKAIDHWSSGRAQPGQNFAKSHQTVTQRANHIYPPAPEQP